MKKRNNTAADRNGRRARERILDTLPHRITLHEVASAANVSPMTVSNVINGRYFEMAAETRRRVEEAIQRLNYRPHTRGRRLRLAKNLSVGMIIIHEQGSFLADPFITQLITGLNNQLFACGYGLFLQGVKPDQLGQSVLVRNVETDGICTMVSGPPQRRAALLRHLIGLGQPVVVFQETSRFRGEDVCVIRQSDHEGARQLAERVLRKGARNLVYLRPSLDWAAVEERVSGIREALAAVRGAALRVVVGDSLDFKATQTALHEDIEKNGVPDAVLAANDQIGIAAMKLLIARGCKVPGEVLVTGFNGFELWQYSDPPLTTVRSPAYEMGRLAGRSLLHRLQANSFRVKNIVLPTVLQIGGSA